MHPTQSLNIRPAERRDCLAISNLVRELAIFEKMEEQNKTTPEVLERDGFDANPPYFRCIVAEVSESESQSPLENASSGENTDENDSANGSSNGSNSRVVIIGYALYFYTYSTWEGKAIHLEDFYITTKFRQGGVGSKIITELAKIAVEGGFARVTFVCLDWNENAIKFYTKHNAINITKRDGFHVYRFEKAVLPKLAGLDKLDC